MKLLHSKNAMKSRKEDITANLHYLSYFVVIFGGPVTLPDVNIMDLCWVEHYVYENGTNGASVELYKVINGGHTWPGAYIPLPGINTNQDFSETIQILANKDIGKLDWIEYRDLQKGGDAFKQIHDGTCSSPKIILIP